MIHCEFENESKAELRHVTCDIIVADDDGRILLTKRGPSLTEAGKWAIPGGYADRDESLAQTAVRELLEETGWQCSDPELFVVNDDPGRVGDDRQNVTFVFTARAVRRISNDYDRDEVAEIEWFALDALPDPIAFDHGNALDLYRSAMAGGHRSTLFVR